MPIECCMQISRKKKWLIDPKILMTKGKNLRCFVTVVLKTDMRHYTTLLKTGFIKNTTRKSIQNCIKMSKYSNMKATDISEEDKKQIRAIIKEFCKGLIVDGASGQTEINESIVMIVAFARKSEFATPLFTHFVDVCIRQSIRNWLNQKPKEEQKKEEQKMAFVSSSFHNNYKFMQDLQQTAPKLHQIFAHLITTFYKRVFNFPEMGPKFTKYDDDLGDYIDITKRLNESIRGMVCVLCALF